MKKTIHRCMRCQRIIGVNIQPGNNDVGDIDDNLECIKCYNKQNWSELDSSVTGGK
jgi:hypothetical protein